MNTQTKLIALVLKVTGYRFPKSGMFGRGTVSREWLRRLGISPIGANAHADCA